jgi:NDP-sugar pyrophosphorylase family protein
MSRERVTISINNDLLKKIDQQIDGTKIRNRSHAVESLIYEALGLDQIKDAIIMAGGNDVMKNITAIKDSLLRLKKLGISEVIVAVGFLADKIKKELKSGQDFGLKLDYLEKGEGTGGSLFLLKKAIKKSFIVVNINKQTDIDYEMLADFHKSSGKITTIATDDVKSFKGVYILEPKIFDYIPKGFSMLEEDIFPNLLKDNELAIYPVIK